MLNRDELNKLMQVVEATHEDEIDCDECLEQVDRFVEMKLAGLDAEEAMPLVQDHLEKCEDCREEFEALLVTIQSIQEDPDEGGALDSVRRLWRRIRGE
jgi:hypothetical protein